MTLPADPYIRNLIEQGEHEQLDFKYEISDARKIARSYSAFSNCRGGILLIGVKDNGRIAGIRSEEEYYMAEAAARLYCRPEVRFTARKWQVEGRFILEVRIPERAQKPVAVKEEDGQWRAYFRVEDQNLQADPIQLKLWKGKKTAIFIRYSGAENSLLNYLAEHDSISLTAFTRLAHLRHTEAEDILVKLILANVLDMQVSLKGIRFTLHAQEDR